MTMTGYQKATLRAVVADLRREVAGADFNDITFAMSRHARGCEEAAGLLERRFGSWQDLTDDGYERLARQYRRGLEDHEAGLGTGMGLSVPAIRKMLARIERMRHSLTGAASCAAWEGL